MTTYTVYVDADDPDSLIEDFRALERRGYSIRCHALDEKMRLRERDGFLVQALELMSGTRWGRCTALAAEIQKFESIIWPRIREVGEQRRAGPAPKTEPIAPCNSRP